MNYRKILAVAALAVATAVSAYAAQPIGLALWAPELQTPSPLDDITGLRLAIYGKNHDITGLDVHIVGITTGDMNGVTWNWIYNRVEGDFNGIGWDGFYSRVKGDTCGISGAIVNFDDADATGLFSGLYSQVDGEMTGLQIGFVNKTETLTGLQLGLLNMAENGRGVQLGLINIFDAGFLPVFPIINCHF